jgi:hypothetical protein
MHVAIGTYGLHVSILDERQIANSLSDNGTRQYGHLVAEHFSE